MTLKASLLALLVIAIWGFNFVMIKIGVTEIPGMALLALRYGLTGLIFLPFMKWPGWRQALMISSIGLLFGLLHQGLLYVGLEYMPSGLMSILLQTNVIFGTLLGIFFFKETIGWRTWAGIALGMAGIVVLKGGADPSAAPAIGFVVAIASALFAALGYLMAKKVGKIHPMTYLALFNLPISPFIALSSLVMDGTDWIASPEINWTAVATVVAFQVSILAYSHILWQQLLIKYPMGVIIPWSLLIPVFAVFPAAPMLGEPITASILIGGAMTVGGVAIVTFRRISKSNKTEM